MNTQEQPPFGDEVYQKNIEDWWCAYIEKVKEVHPSWSDEEVQTHVGSVKDENRLWEFYGDWLQGHLSFTEEQASQKIEEAKQDITSRDHATTLYVMSEIFALDDPHESSE